MRSSISHRNAPLLVVPKMRTHQINQLNNRTIGDLFPIPNIRDILDQLESAKYFTALDLASGYRQIAMVEKGKHKIAFSTPYKHYKFNRIRFGLKNAPTTINVLTINEYDTSWHARTTMLGIFG